MCTMDPMGGMKKYSDTSIDHEAPDGYSFKDDLPAGSMEGLETVSYKNDTTTFCAKDTDPVPAIIFEGYEKRLELTFGEEIDLEITTGIGLRALNRDEIDSITDWARCRVVYHVAGEEFDSYVLSESSLFVYQHKLIMKTCGTTLLLLAIPRILELAGKLKLHVISAKYSRGTFLFPDAQLYPHRCFSEEVELLNSYFGCLQSGGNEYVFGDPSNPKQKWHVYYATDKPEKPVVTLEMCMTRLDTNKAAVFFKSASDGLVSTAKKMTEISGIADIIPEMHISDFEFEPCGYSMNAICGSAFSTIHVTPEEGWSFASYEVMGFEPLRFLYNELIERVLTCFRPSEFSVAVTIYGAMGEAESWAKKLIVEGYGCRTSVEQLLPGGAILVYQVFYISSDGC